MSDDPAFPSATRPDIARPDPAAQDPGLPHYRRPAGGWGSVEGMARTTREARPSPVAARVLARLNKPGGPMCTSCAWQKPVAGIGPQFCENGAKATLWELDERRAGPDLFAARTLAELRTMDDHDLESLGRLTHPMRYDPASDRYLPVTWEAAAAEIGAALRAADPARSVFYASGHAGLEASYLYALFARAMGHQNLPQSSNMCHETTSVMLGSVLGTPVGTCTHDDFEECDAIFIFGQNPGTNSPRFLHTLKAAVERGARIVSFNPLRERGLVEFADPKSPLQMTVAPATRLSEQLYQIRPGGDVAALAGLMKCVFAAEAARPGAVLDHAFIAAHTSGFEEMRAAIEAAPWDRIERESGLTQAMIAAAAEVYIGARAVIGVYGMGLTQQVDGWLNLGMFTNLLLLRGNMGRPGAGLSPVRGHSNVQGQRSVGIGHKSAHMPADKLRALFGIEAPQAEGMTVVRAAEAVLEGRIEAVISLGGNLLRALPDRERIEAAWPGIGLTVHVATKPNRSHLVPGRVAFLLPCLSRAEADRQGGAAQAIAIEDSFSQVCGSIGMAEPAGAELRSEVWIVAALAKAALAPDPRLDWDGWAADYDRIRDLIAATFPESFHDFNARLAAPGGFNRGNPARRREWRTATGRAIFTAPPVLSALGDRPEGAEVMTLVTLRSNDQFNTTIYGHSDRLRGLEGDRMIALAHPAEIARLGLREGARVALETASTDGVARRVGGLTLTAYDLPEGTVAGYYPELNPLVPLGLHERRSDTPAYKGTPVRIVAEG